MSEKRMTKSKSKKGLFRSLGLIAIAIYFCFVMVDMKVTLAEKSEELIVQEQKLEEQRIINKDTQRLIAQGVNSDEVERKAREMGYVKKDEIIFKDSSGN